MISSNFFTFYETYFSHPGRGHGSLTRHMTQFAQSGWLRLTNFTSFIFESWTTTEQNTVRKMRQILRTIYQGNMTILRSEARCIWCLSVNTPSCHAITTCGATSEQHSWHHNNYRFHCVFWLPMLTHTRGYAHTLVQGPITQRFMAWSRPKPVKKLSPVKQTMFALMSSLNL